MDRWWKIQREIVKKERGYGNKLKRAVLERTRIKMIRYCDAVTFEPFEFWPSNWPKTYGIYIKYKSWVNGLTYLLRFAKHLSANPFPNVVVLYRWYVTKNKIKNLAKMKLKKNIKEDILMKKWNNYWQTKRHIFSTHLCFQSSGTLNISIRVKKCNHIL